MWYVFLKFYLFWLIPFGKGGWGFEGGGWNGRLNKIGILFAMVLRAAS